MENDRKPVNIYIGMQWDPDDVFNGVGAIGENMTLLHTIHRNKFQKDYTYKCERWNNNASRW